jgi:class 3 adenylate cyclase
LISLSDSQTGDARALEKALAREAATRNVLEVISLNPDDEQPIFDAILKSATKLCNAPHGVLLLRNSEDTHLVIAAANTDNSGIVKMVRANPHSLSDEKSLSVEAVKSMQVRQYRDIEELRDYQFPSEQLKVTLELERMRTLLYVPLIKGDRAIGVLALYRLEVSEFTDDDIELLKTFAAQAVMCIEHVRQFRAIQSANAELQIRLEREAATGEILSAISQFRNDETPVFEAILENAARLCRAPHAFLQLRNEADTHLEVAAQNFATSKFLDLLRANPIPTQNNEGSISIRGMKSPTPTQYDDIRLLKGSELYTPQLGFAMDAEGMRTGLFVPLISVGEGIGVICLYKHEVAPFNTDEISLVQTFAAQAVIAIENVRQFKALESLNAELGDRVKEQVGEIERMGRLKRFLPAAVADTVISQGSDKMLSSHRALLGVLFCDIRGFTAFCETAEPEETIEVLQTYHEEMGKLINAHGAGVDHRMGDGIMVLFNDPLPCDDPAGEAVRLAIAMRERMAELSKKWKRLGYRLGFGVGVSLGYATVGMVGFEGRFDYTASGTAINLAARLCDEAEDGEILLSPRAGVAVEDAFQVESRGEISLKGIREPLEVLRLTSAAKTKMV